MRIRVTCVGDSITITVCSSMMIMLSARCHIRGSRVSCWGPSIRFKTWVTPVKRCLKMVYAAMAATAVEDQMANARRRGQVRLVQSVRTLGASAKFAHWDQTTYKRATASAPDVVTIMLGTKYCIHCPLLRSNPLSTYPLQPHVLGSDSLRPHTIQYHLPQLYSLHSHPLVLSVTRKAATGITLLMVCKEKEICSRMAART